MVTFNRKDLLLHCISTLAGQSRPLDAIYVIDNGSTDGTVALLAQHGFISEGPEKENAFFQNHARIDTGAAVNRKVDLYYVRFPENMGGAYGFSEGMKRTCEDGYDWIWLMDDDSHPHSDALKAMNPFLTSADTVAVAPAVKGPDDALSLKHRGMLHCKHIFPRFQTPLEEALYLQESVPINSASFVGLLMRSSSVREAGYPKGEFFLNHDDIEYCLRLSKTGNILLVPASIMYHEEEIKRNCKTSKIFGKTVYRPPYNELWLKYFGFRNLVWLGRRYIRPRALFYMEAFFYYFVQILLVIRYDGKKLKRIRFYTNALKDGLQGIFDNEKPKRLLYD